MKKLLLLLAAGAAAVFAAARIQERNEVKASWDAATDKVED